MQEKPDWGDLRKPAFQEHLILDILQEAQYMVKRLFGALLIAQRHRVEQAQLPCILNSVRRGSKLSK